MLVISGNAENNMWNGCCGNLMRVEARVKVRVRARARAG